MKFLNKKSGSLANLQQDKMLLAIGRLMASNQITNMDKFKCLSDAEFKVFSQWGEDGILNYIFEVLGLTKPRIMEVGASNFIECNSRFAAEHRNARVYAVDLNPELISTVQAMDLSWKNHIFPVMGKITPENIQSHERQANELMFGIDLVSFDIDGNDYWCLEKMLLKNVSVVVVEVNPLFGDKINVTVPRNDSFDRNKAHFSNLFFGMSYKASLTLLGKKGFTCIGSNLAGNNIFFVRKEFVDRFEQILNDDLPTVWVNSWNVRESRDKEFSLNYLSNSDRLNEILECTVYDLDLNQNIILRELISQSRE
jgi:hypothetical protein